MNVRVTRFQTDIFITWLKFSHIIKISVERKNLIEGTFKRILLLYPGMSSMDTNIHMTWPNLVKYFVATFGYFLYVLLISFVHVSPMNRRPSYDFFKA